MRALKQNEFRIEGRKLFLSPSLFFTIFFMMAMIQSITCASKNLPHLLTGLISLFINLSTCFVIPTAFPHCSRKKKAIFRQFKIPLDVESLDDFADVQDCFEKTFLQCRHAESYWKWMMERISHSCQSLKWKRNCTEDQTIGNFKAKQYCL